MDGRAGSGGQVATTNTALPPWLLSLAAPPLAASGPRLLATTRMWPGDMLCLACSGCGGGRGAVCVSQCAGRQEPAAAASWSRGCSRTHGGDPPSPEHTVQAYKVLHAVQGVGSKSGRATSWCCSGLIQGMAGGMHERLFFWMCCGYSSIREGVQLVRRASRPAGPASASRTSTGMTSCAVGAATGGSLQQQLEHPQAAHTGMAASQPHLPCI